MASYPFTKNTPHLRTQLRDPPRLAAQPPELHPVRLHLPTAVHRLLIMTVVLAIPPLPNRRTTAACPNPKARKITIPDLNDPQQIQLQRGETPNRPLHQRSVRRLHRQPRRPADSHLPKLVAEGNSLAILTAFADGTTTTWIYHPH